jgi:tetratricopeptide (TPR) repeat protein
LAEVQPEVAAAQPELLAHHYSEAGDAWKAVEAWHQAGELAIQRGGAALEAERHLCRGLEVLAILPQGRERDGIEFRLQLQLGYSLMLTRGYSAPEVEQAYRRAQVLSEGLGDPSQVVTLLMGLWLSAYGRRGPAAAQPLADQVLTAVERAGLDELTVWPCLAQGMTRFQAGDLAGASEHLARGRAAHTEKVSAQMGLDPLVGILVFEAMTAVHRGYADRARESARQAIERCQQSGLPGGDAWARLYAGVLACHLRDPDGVRVQLERLADAGPGALLAQSDMLGQLHGWLLVEEGRFAEGIALLRQHIQNCLAVEQRLALEWRMGQLADALGRSGEVGEAMHVLEEAQGVLAGPSVFRAETLRLRAELLAKAGAGAETEAAFRAALDLAREQGSATYALRTATSLARWLASAGRAREALSLLAPVYSGVTEGFDTRDLVEAKALLGELRCS